MRHLGDITKINWFEVEPVDCVTGGSPCQDLSVAGKRAGLAGERSGLYIEQIRCVKELRQRDIQSGRTGAMVRPRWMVWENVPGAFSSNGGKDFAAVLEEAVKIVEPQAPPIPVPDKGWPSAGCLSDVDGRWSIAWRVHDAQFWGVPQRRRRIALVCDFGGMSAPEVLFERKGLRGDTAESGTAREGIAGDAEAGFNSAVRDVTTYCLQGNGIDRADAAGCNGKGWREDVSYTLNTIDRPAVYAFDSLASNSMKSSNPHSGCRQVEIAKTLDCADPNPSKNQGGMAILHCYDMNAVSQTVRRLTPLECERLQGYPDGWTDIGEWIDSKGKKHQTSDTSRYKALGNSIALPFWYWMMQNMAEYLPEKPTLGSLFDGIGGFPLCWERIHGKGTARWASEIEEFPMAVTKKRFGEG